MPRPRRAAPARRTRPDGGALRTQDRRARSISTHHRAPLAAHGRYLLAENVQVEASQPAVRVTARRDDLPPKSGTRGSEGPSAAFRESSRRAHLSTVRAKVSARKSKCLAVGARMQHRVAGADEAGELVIIRNGWEMDDVWGLPHARRPGIG